MKPETLKLYRHLLGLSTREASFVFECAQRTWQCYEKGTRKVPDWLASLVKHTVREEEPKILSLLKQARR